MMNSRLYEAASTIFLTLLALFLAAGLTIAWLKQTIALWSAEAGNRQKIAYTAYDRMRAFDQAFVREGGHG